MGTRARIGIKNADGTVTSMYVHCDGYPKEGPFQDRSGVGWQLSVGYTTAELVRALVAKGELLGLESTLEASVVFDDDARAPITHSADDWPESGQEHEYLFVGPKDASPGVWFYRTDGRSRAFGWGPQIEGGWRPLDEVLREA